jgi:hypothetical protein
MIWKQLEKDVRRFCRDRRDSKNIRKGKIDLFTPSDI